MAWLGEDFLGHRICQDRRSHWDDGLPTDSRQPRNQLLTRDLGDGRTELITLSWWSDLDAIRAFAGSDISAAKYYPEDDAYLVDRETTVAHFDVTEQPEATAAPDTGFAITRVLPGHPQQVFAHFVEPELFARWFIVDGFHTPVARLRLDPRVGGAIEGVMVAEDESLTVPFTASYGRVEAPTSVQFVFTDPNETVTLTVLDLGDEGSQLIYRNHGASLAGRARTIAAVDTMLDALDQSLRQLRSRRNQ